MILPTPEFFNKFIFVQQNLFNKTQNTNAVNDSGSGAGANANIVPSGMVTVNGFPILPDPHLSRSHLSISQSHFNITLIRRDRTQSHLNLTRSHLNFTRSHPISPQSPISPNITSISSNITRSHSISPDLAIPFNLTSTSYNYHPISPQYHPISFNMIQFHAI